MKKLPLIDRGTPAELEMISRQNVFSFSKSWKIHELRRPEEKEGHQLLNVQATMILVRDGCFETQLSKREAQDVE